MKFNRNLNIYILLFCVSAFCTYLTQHIFHLNEFLAEGIPTIIGSFIVFYVGIKFVRSNFKPYNAELYLYLTYLTYLISITLLSSIINNENLFKLIFIYQYVPVFILLLNFSKAGANKLYFETENAFIIIGLLGSISAIFGVMQFLHLIEIVPIDISRARGLSRSTLNFSTLMFLSYVAAANISNLKIRNIFLILILAGVFASQSRGALLSVGIFTAFNFYNSRGFYKACICYFSLLAIFLMVLEVRYDVVDYLFKNTGASDLFLRLKNGSNLSSPDNSLRVQRYLSFFQDFSLFGRGIGSTGPGANRLQEGTHFESFILNILSQGGLVAIFFWPIFAFLSILRLLPVSSKILAIIVSFFSMMALQQTFENPSVNLTAWLLVFLYIMKYSRSYTNNEKIN
jgi:hypothetical protein